MSARSRSHGTHLYLVELINQAVRGEDVAWKVRAINKMAARDIVETRVLRGHRVGAVVLAQGNISKKDRETASRLRSICTGAL